MRHTRRGFTMIEMLTVFAIFGILALMVFPKFNRAISQSALRSSKQEVASALARTRATAIQRGRSARLVRSGHTFSILVDSASTVVPLGGGMDLHREYKVLVSVTRDTISYDARGMAVGLGNVEKIFLARDGFRDSVCVTRLGRIGVRDCTS